MIRKLIKIGLYLLMVSILTFLIYQAIFFALLTYYILDFFNYGK
jgi:hypothetical protein